MAAGSGHTEQRESLFDELLGLDELDFRVIAPIILDDASSTPDLARLAGERILAMADALQSAESPSRHAVDVRTVEALHRHLSACTALLNVAITRAHASAADTLNDPQAVPGAPRVHPGSPDGDRWLTTTQAAAASLGPVLGIGNGQAQARCHEARRLAVLPALRQRLLDGDWTPYHQHRVLQSVRGLDDDVLPELDEFLATRHEHVSAADLARQVDGWLARHGYLTDHEQKHRQGMAQRFTWISDPDLYGMSRLTGYLPSLVMEPIRWMITGTTEETCTQHGGDEAPDGRTREQVMADVFMTLLNGPAALAPALSRQPEAFDPVTGYAAVDAAELSDAQQAWEMIHTLLRSIRPDIPAPPRNVRLDIDVPIDTLLRLQADLAPHGPPGLVPRPCSTTENSATEKSNDPRGWAAGVGWLTHDQLQWVLASMPHLRRIITDPETGAPLDIGTTIHRATRAMRTRVHKRDRYCRFPYCTREATNPRSGELDLDHLTEHHTDGTGGPTADHNLAVLCRAHHKAKHQTDWTPTMHRDGRITWRSTHLGLTITTAPPS